MTNSAGLGLIVQGTRDWKNYEVATAIVPLLAEAWGLATRVQGRERYYALMFGRAEGGDVRPVRRRHRATVLAAQAFPWRLDQAYVLTLQVKDKQLRASVNGELLFEVQDRSDEVLDGGDVALIIDTGSISTREVRVSPL